MSVTNIRFPDRICQADLDNYLLLQNLAADFAQKRDEAGRRLVDLITAGATTEDGTHTATLKRTFKNAKAITKLCVR